MSSRPQNRWPACFGLFLLLPTLACQEAKQEPVAALSATPVRIELPFGRSAPLELQWKMLAPLGEEDGEPLVFVHLFDDEGEVRLTLDHPFPATWRAGEEVTDPLRIYHSALAPALPGAPGRN